jgi:polyferredoxin
MGEFIFQLYLSVTQFVAEYLADKFSVRDRKPWWLRLLVGVLVLVIALVAAAGIFLLVVILYAIAAGFYRAVVS